MNKNSTGNIVDWLLLKRVLGFAKPYRKYFVIGTISAILLSFLGPIRPLLINFAVDNFIVQANYEGLLNIIALLFILLFLEGFFQFLYIYISTYIGQHVIQDLRAKIFKHIISLKMRYYDNTPIGTLVTRSISDVETISDIFSQGLLVIIAELLKLLVVISLMLYTDVKLTLITMLTLPLLLIATSWFKKNIKSAFQDVREQVSQLNTFVQERLVGMQIVQIFNQEHREFKNFQNINNKHQSAHLRSIFYYAIFFPIVEVLSAISIALVVWFGGQSILQGQEVTIGELIAFILYIHMMFRPIRQLADRFNILQMGIVGSERIFKVLDTEAKILNNGNKKNNIFGNISFKDVDFAYKKNQWILKGFNLSIRAKQMIAIVGSTGSGKTTIINLLSRFYEIQNGQINIDDTNIKDFDLEFLRSNIGLVQQDVFLFSDTILNNITLYDSTITKENVIRSAKLIGAHDFISKLPKGYDYVVGERGLTISTGERQLIAFLRVYVRNPKILILDEATSSVDTKTESLIQTALDTLLHERTTIVIAHRLSTIVKSDKILYLEKGKVIEQGTHTELMKISSKYSSMFKNQQEDIQ